MSAGMGRDWTAPSTSTSTTTREVMVRWSFDHAPAPLKDSSAARDSSGPLMSHDACAAVSFRMKECSCALPGISSARARAPAIVFVQTWNRVHACFSRTPTISSSESFFAAAVSYESVDTNDST